MEPAPPTGRAITGLRLPASVSASESDHARFLLGSVGCCVETRVVFCLILSCVCVWGGRFNTRLLVDREMETKETSECCSPPPEEAADRFITSACDASLSDHAAFLTPSTHVCRVPHLLACERRSGRWEVLGPGVRRPAILRPTLPQSAG